METATSPTEETESVNHATQLIQQHQQKPPPPKPKQKPAVAVKPQLRDGVPVKRDANNQVLLATVRRTGGTAAQTTNMEVSSQPQQAHRSPQAPTTRRSPPPPPRQNVPDNSLFNDARQPAVSRSPAVVSQLPALPARTRAPQPSHARSTDNLSSHRALPVPPDPGQVRTTSRSTPSTPTTARAPPPPVPPSRTAQQHIRASGPGMFQLF